MSFSLDLYRIFLAVAQNGSFSAAAGVLYITQPAVSQAISQLERELGVKLFIRTGRGAALTGEGEVLRGYIEGALGTIQRAENHFSELSTLAAGTLKIGASDTLCRHYLLPYLNTFHSCYPTIQITVTNRTSSETVALLNENKIDLGFVNLPTPAQPNISVKELVAVQDCFVCGERYFSKFTGPVGFDYLSGFPILMLEQLSSTRRYLDEFFKWNNIDLPVQIELGSLDLLLEFAAAGLGIAAVTKEYASEYLASGKLHVIELLTPIPHRSVGMIYQRNVPLSVAAKEFLKLIEAEI